MTTKDQNESIGPILGILFVVLIVAFAIVVEALFLIAYN